MNYVTYIKEGQHLKTLLKLIKLKEKSISKLENLKHLLDGYIFYPISTWPSSIRKILKHNTITDKNTLNLILFAYVNGISSNVFMEYLYTFILNTLSKIRKRTHQLYWIVTNINTKWYNFDMYHRSFLPFNVLKKNESQATHAKHPEIIISPPTHNPTCIHAHQPTTPQTPPRPPHPPLFPTHFPSWSPQQHTLISAPLTPLLHYDTNLPPLHCPPPQHHHYTHPIIHCFNQLTQIHNPLPWENPKLHPPIHNLNTCHSPSTSSPTAYQN